MREIKFRGKRIDDGEWVVGFLELHLVDGDLTKTKQDAFITCDYMDKIGKVYRDRFDVIPETVGQFTGLKDKNGVEIYDGDRAKSSYGITGIVKYEEGSFYIWTPTRKCAFAGLIKLGHNFEVIGNIHENPKILAQG